MNLSVGIVGLPNAGKSTLFNALLKKQVADTAPYPFCTIEPNIGVVPVPDERLIKLAEIVKVEEQMDSLPPQVPAVVEFVDIAGLVKGASQGEGLGNKFLSHIREVDIIIHVVRFFDDQSVMHVSGSVDPKRDIEVIKTELILADLETLEKQAEPKNSKDRDILRSWELISVLKKALNQGKPAADIIAGNDEKALIRDLHLLSIKPVIYVINVSENQLNGVSARDYQFSDNNSLVISAKTEFELASLTANEQKEYLRALGMESSGLSRLIQKAYQTLGLISFLTCGAKEVRAWTITRGTNARKAAGVIHTDFEKKFIKADVVDYSDFVALGGWKNARITGRVRQEGKDYIVEDGDVVEFKIGN